jgi:3-hydroxyacyl-[acyl-carrier-protein] dehydratase
MELYKIETIEREGGKALFKIIYNDNNSIFEGHFPSKPVVPGVMLMQTVKECFEQLEGILTVIESADLKFMNPVLPGDENGVFLEMKYMENENEYKVKSSGFSEEKKFFKINIVVRGIVK